jgi:short-subunit dehydrogenase
MDLRGKNILITGASSGIGHATARALAAQGAILAVSGRKVARLEELADTIASHGHLRPVVLAADLSERGAAESLAARAVEALGTIDILINNAAVEGVGSYAAAGDDEESRDLFETNYWSPSVLNRALLPSMRARGFGALVSVSSLGAITPVAGTGHYASSKAALAIATEALRSELRGSGVHVILVYPGFVDTPMLREFKARPDLTARMRRALSLMPVGRPEGLARAVVRALRRERSTVVYPPSYRVTPLIPAVSRWFTNLLFGRPTVSASTGTSPRRCCSSTLLRRRLSRIARSAA